MKGKRDMTVLRNCICFNLRRVTRIITQQYDAELRRQGIRSTQTPIMQALCLKDSWTMAELSEMLGMDRTTLVRNLRPLERDGLLQNSGGGHGVQVEVSITAKGRKQVEKFTPAWRAAQDKILHTLGEENWASLLDQLETAANNIKN
jgi:DNA-binding MarR family transcriptional regulator